MRTLCTSLLVAALASCASSPHADTTPVTLGMWCEEVIATICHSSATRCKGAAPDAEARCQESARESCLAGRDRGASAGRSGDELRACVRVVRGLSCEALKDQGRIAPSCQAKLAATTP